MGPGYSRVGTFKGVLNFSLRAYGAHHGYHITFLSVHSIVTDRGLPTNLLDVLTRGGEGGAGINKNVLDRHFSSFTGVPTDLLDV